MQTFEIKKIFDMNIKKIFNDSTLYNLQDLLDISDCCAEAMSIKDLLDFIRCIRADEAAYEEALHYLVKMKLPASFMSMHTDELMDVLELHKGKNDDERDLVYDLLEDTVFKGEFGPMYSLTRQGDSSAEDITLGDLLSLCDSMLLGLNFESCTSGDPTPDIQVIDLLADHAKTLLDIFVFEFAELAY